MACVPGTPCFQNGGVVYPQNCGINDCTTHANLASSVNYTGPNLPCTGIYTCDTLNQAFEKINEKLCPESLALSFLSYVQQNSTAFCTIVNNC